MGRREKEHGEGGKNNPPPQAFCLTCVDAKRGLGGFFPPLVPFFFALCLSLMGRFRA